VLHHVLEGKARHGAFLHVLHLHHRLLDLICAVVLVEGELGADAAGVLHQPDPRAVGGHLQQVHDAVHKLLHQLEVLRPDTLGAIDHHHQVNMPSPAFCGHKARVRKDQPGRGHCWSEDAQGWGRAAGLQDTMWVPWICSWGEAGNRAKRAQGSQPKNLCCHRGIP